MKKLLLILLITPLFLLSQESIGTGDLIVISEDLESNWTGVAYKKGIEMSTHAFGTNNIIAEKGSKFLELAIRIKNTSKTKVSVDLSKFQLVDEDSNVYNASLCQAHNLNKINCDEFDFKLKPKKKRIVIINFAPLITDNSSIKIIRYDGVDIYEFK
jgi:hypothetical protein